MCSLYLVRHAETAPNFSQPASTWPLTEAGRVAASTLAKEIDWETVSLVASSPEPKAIETARALMSPVAYCRFTIMDDLRELSAPLVKHPDDFRQQLARLFEGHPETGWENPERALTRILKAAHAASRSASPKRAVVVSHGRILTLLVSHLMRRSPTLTLWEQIAMPDIARVNLKTSVVERPFGIMISPPAPGTEGKQGRAGSPQ